MPYLSFDLDAKKKVAPCARAVGVEPGVIAWGLLELWEHVWLTKDDVVGEMVLDGCFGPLERTREALVAYDFLEKAAVGYRVKGAARYLRVTEAKTKAGKARAASAGRSAGRFENATSTLPAHHQQPTSTPPAADQLLHRTPSTECLEASSASPIKAAQPELKLEAQVAKKQATPSRQQRLAEKLSAQRDSALPADATPDKRHSVARTNTMLQELTELDEQLVLDAHWLYCQDLKRRGQSPPCRLDWFANDWPEYLDRARKEPAA